MKPTPRRLVLALLMLFALTCGACGSAGDRPRLHASASTAAGAGAGATTGSKPAIPAETATTKRFLNDGDRDLVGDADGDNRADTEHDPRLDYLPSDSKEGESNRYHDADDLGLLTFGHAPTSQEELAIVAAAQRYYATAASEDGASACTQLTPSLAQAVPADYGQQGPAYLHSGKTCAAVMTLLFEHYHEQLAAGVTVTSVRISSNDEEAYAILGSTAFPASYIILQHEHNSWMIDQLLSTENRQG